MPPIQVLIVEDSETYLQGLTALLQREDRVVVVGTAGSQAEAVKCAAECKPDVAMVDLRIVSTPAASRRRFYHGIRTIAELKATMPAVHILAMSTWHRKRHLADAIRAGASGFVSKSATPEQIIAALRAVARGKAVLTAEQLAAVAEPQTEEAPALTERQRQVLDLLGEGKTNREIAEALGIEYGTVRTHVENLRGKLAAATRDEVVARARTLGLL